MPTITIDEIFTWSQANGACFEAYYSYAKGSRQKIRGDASRPLLPPISHVRFRRTRQPELSGDHW
ncbi:MAG: hypothetical protein E5V75_35110 [Mesorhizobium sp.]|nr:MAG: hypothetical protein E5V75_35110 [Mesorhizobium sp.]